MANTKVPPIAVYTTKETRDAIFAAAEAERLPMSRYVERILMRFLNGDLVERPTVPMFHAPAQHQGPMPFRPSGG